MLVFTIIVALLAVAALCTAIHAQSGAMSNASTLEEMSKKFYDLGDEIDNLKRSISGNAGRIDDAMRRMGVMENRLNDNLKETLKARSRSTENKGRIDNILDDMDSTFRSYSDRLAMLETKLHQMGESVEGISTRVDESQAAHPATRQEKVAYIISRRDAGEPWKRIVNAVGMPRQTCQNIYAREKAKTKND